MTSLNIISNDLTPKIVYAWFIKPTAPAITTHTYSSLTIPTCNTRGSCTNNDLPKRGKKCIRDFRKLGLVT